MIYLNNAANTIDARPTQTAEPPSPERRPLALFSSSPEFLVSLLAVVKSIALRHVNCASVLVTTELFPPPGKKTVRIGVMLKKLAIKSFTSVVP